MSRDAERAHFSSPATGADSAEPASIALDVPSLSLPSGGGAIKGIDETFSVNAVNGTASLSVPLPFSPARDATPALSLSYNTSAGNGVFGLGWRLSLPSIKRKTDGELPQYSDADTYLFCDAEDLVPEFKRTPDGGFEIGADGQYVFKEEASGCGCFIVKHYRMRVESLFSRVERWTHRTTGEIKWRVISKDNETTLFGWTDASRIVDPKDNSRIYQWLPEFSFDDKGNCVQYLYRREDDAGLDRASLHNGNRLADGAIAYTNLYLERVLYGNRTPYPGFRAAYPAKADYFFETAFDYGQYDADAPYTNSGQWGFRGDPFSDYKPGFEVRTTRLCRRVLLLHRFEELPGGSALVKSLDFSFADPDEAGFALLQSITEHGYIKAPDGSYVDRHLPPMEFDYQTEAWNRDIRSVPSADLARGPSSGEEQTYQFVDLYNEGVPGILTEQVDGWSYQRNLGQGRFGTAQQVARAPSFAGAGSGLQVVDLEGDGSKQLVSLRNEPRGFFELDDAQETRAFRSFDRLPNIPMGDANTRFIDLTGNGKLDILVAESNAFTWYESCGRQGFRPGRRAPKSFDEELDPQLVFADATQSIFVADMSGDGLSDIVRIGNGRVCYWPNLGYGKFGARVQMDNAPVFDHPEAFDPAHLRLADVDGSGTTDLIYLGKNTLCCWKNLSGNRFSTQAFEINAFPQVHSHAQVSVANLLGDGVACIVWSSSLAKDAGAPLRYIDLMGGKKPYVLTGYRNNFGKEVSLDYTSSTRFYLADRRDGRKWLTTLPFPVQCVSKAETRDRVTGHRFVSAYSYHHGVFDPTEREFRGFGMVAQTDSEDFDHWVTSEASNIVERPLHQTPVVTKHWFHTGAWVKDGNLLNQFAHEHWQEELARKGFATGEPEAQLPDIRLFAAPGLDAKAPVRFSAEDWRQALRACKGRGLREEVFAKDPPMEGATSEEFRLEQIPYSVNVRNHAVELLQPKGPNKHAVFVVKDNETITYDYDRDVADPRISHQLNLALDEQGNVLASAAITYPRRHADASLPRETQEAQARTALTYAQQRYTNDIEGTHARRLRQPSERQVFELKGVAKSGAYYRADDFHDILSPALCATVDYAAFDSTPTDGRVQARLIEHVRQTFYRDDLSGALPLHQMGPLALLHETYQLAFTPTLLADVFGDRVRDDVMREGKFTHFDGDANWWVRSGTKQYLDEGETAAQARERFYAPVAFVDPYGARTKIKYYHENALLMEEIQDAAGNTTRAERYDFRTLSPTRLKDANSNLSEVLLDALGLVKASAVYGKGDEADDLEGLTAATDDAEDEEIAAFFASANSVDLTARAKRLLQHATTRFVYDLDAYRATGGPAAVACILREEHVRKNDRAPVQISFEFSNGLGQVVMEKAQFAPGLAKGMSTAPDGSVVVSKVDTSALTPKQLRWLGSGRTVLNNKGNPVKQYEPYFSVSHRYEDHKALVETGVATLTYYDALGRVTKTEQPDGTVTKTEFGAWTQSLYDANDTVTDTPWYDGRINRSMDGALVAEGKDPAREAAAAAQAAKHADTPETRAFDALGQTVLETEYNRDPATGEDQFYHTRHEVDIQGHLRRMTDAKGNVTLQYKYDMLGNKVFQSCMDAGQRWVLPNALGDPLRTWDERGHEIQYAYDDPLHRPTQSRVLGGDGPVPLDHIFDRTVYGETVEDAEQKNLRGKVLTHYDTAGVVETAAYDFNGQPRSTTRRLLRDYKGVANWVDANLVSALEEDAFTSVAEADALGRTTRQTAPDGSVTLSSYDQGGLLHSLSVALPGAAAATPYVRDIRYNEKRQREQIRYGNGTVTTFRFDRQTFQLKQLTTVRANGDQLQDWRYTYDPVGNVTCIEDRNAPAAFFDNQKIAAVSTYAYDALYRLREATGRENAASADFDRQDGWHDLPFMRKLSPGDPIAMRNYAQSYQYDAVGNIMRMRHVASGNTWTRDYAYQADSNRLHHTRVGTNTYAYPHDRRHGFMTAMPHLDRLDWSFKEELASSARQKRNGGTPETTYYQYDSQGQRVRKITENQAAAGIAPTRKEERVYLDGYEVYKRHSGNAAGLERVSLSLMSEDHRLAMIETRNSVDDGTERQLVRYQLQNHLGSASLEVSGSAGADIISYEEHHPYGTTAFQARNAAIRSAAKRYRFTGMERDEESGLEHHGARYYAPWLGRWLSCDPLLRRDMTGHRRQAAGQTGCDPGGGDSPSAQRPPAHGAETRRDPRRANRPARRPRHRPDPLYEPVLSEDEGPPDPKDLNPYAYVYQNPVIYRDPTGHVGVIQAWYDAYGSSGTGGKVGYGLLFIFAYLTHVIVNLVVLLFAITIVNPTGLFGALDFTWGAPQSVLGLAAGIFLILLGADVSPQWGFGAKVEMPAYMGNPGGMSLGPVVLAGHGFSHYPHEFGHTLQSRLLGPFYLIVIGIPSLISAATDPANHSTFYTETWADAWAP